MLVPVRLIGTDGHGVELTVAGYQFPDHPDLRERRSWLVIEGTGHAGEGSWSFRWPALTPDDAVLVPEWLRLAAAGAMPVAEPHDLSGACDGCLHFAEPNLGFAVAGLGPGRVTLRLEFDLEFAPPWQVRSRAGNPYELTCELPASALLTAADEWDAEIARFPP
jgi:hypothetical protein